MPAARITSNDQYICIEVMLQSYRAHVIKGNVERISACLQKEEVMVICKTFVHTYWYPMDIYIYICINSDL